ncbi:MAG TPA: tyrosine-type recombinase/integrase [Blastocatellia bacterium]
MSRTFTIASDKTLCQMIENAKERLVLVAPGLSREVAQVLTDRIQHDGGPKVLSVVLDTDPEVCRLGYGDIETFDLLTPALAPRGLSIQMQQGVRIGLIVADGEVLVYSPTPKLIEAGSVSEEKPNAIRITEKGAEELALACGAVESAVLPLEQEIGLDQVSARHTSATLLMASGVNPKTVSDRLGHSDVEITLRVYTHPTEGMQAEASREIERVLSGQK